MPTFLWCWSPRWAAGNAPSPACRDKSLETFDLYVGLTNLKAARNHTQWFEVNQVILHPSYQMHHPIGGDVALVQLKSRITFSDAVLPVCVAPADLNLTGLACWATGWGLISQQGKSRCRPQEQWQRGVPKAMREK